MTTEDHGTIDFVAYDREAGCVILVVVEERPWGERGGLLPDLQAKLNTYLEYVTSGQLKADYAEASKASVQIELRCTYPLGTREKEFLDIAIRNYFRPENIEFSWNLI
jgi:hypothetical protein